MERNIHLIMKKCYYKKDQKNIKEKLEEMILELQIYNIYVNKCNMQRNILKLKLDLSRNYNLTSR